MDYNNFVEKTENGLITGRTAKIAAPGGAIRARSGFYCKKPILNGVSQRFPVVWPKGGPYTEITESDLMRGETTDVLFLFFSGGSERKSLFDPVFCI